MTASDGQMGNEGIDCADLNTCGTQRVAHASRCDMIFARGREVLQRREHLDDLRPGSFGDDALEQFLQDHPGGGDDLTTSERIPQCPDLSHIRGSVPAQRERPDARVDEQAHPRERSAL
jgi:hypothetical protein